MEFIVNARDIRVQVSDVISVQEDNETQTIDFRINKTEHEYDLASLHPYVLFKPYRANGVDFCIVEKKIDGDSIVLTWLINRAVTFAEGELQFQIVFSDSLDPAIDKGTKRWATKIAKVKIPESLLGNKFVLPESQILSQLIALADRVQNGAAAAKESETAAAVSAKSAADNAIKTGQDRTAAETAAREAETAKDTAITKASEIITASELAQRKAAEAEAAKKAAEDIEIRVSNTNTDLTEKYNEVKQIGDQVAADKLEIDQTIKESIISSSEEIISSMEAYLAQANALYSSMYFNADGENPAARAVTLVTIDCGNPASRAVNPGIIFDGGTPLTRILGQ